MSKRLHLLQVEDSESDAALVENLLWKAGYEICTQRLDTADAMRSALASLPWDLVVADHSTVGFDALSALAVLHESGKEIPFVVVSSGVSDEQAAALMKSGAHAYLRKDNLACLAPAIEHELREAESRRIRRKAEQDLRENQEKLALAIQATRLGTFDYSTRTGTLICSEFAKRHFGLRTDAKIDAETLLRGVHPEDRERIRNLVESFLQGKGGEFSAEFRTIGIDDGVERCVSCWGNVYVDARQHQVRLIGGTLDTTAPKRLRDEFLDAQKMESLGHLAAGVAHDLNNLLTVINGYCDMLLAELQLRDPLHENISEIRAAGARGAALSGQLLLVSGKQVVEPVTVNWNDVVAEFTGTFRRIIGEEILLESSLSPDLGCVLADPGQLHQVLMNLAINARDAMPAGGTLRIQTRNVDLEAGDPNQGVALSPGPYVEIQVSDTGIGIPTEVLPHIFEPFSTRQAGNGSGLGLAAVYGIVHQGGGSISVSSEPMPGTKFRIWMPRVVSDVPAPNEPKFKTRDRHGTETILVVEDEDQVRKVAVLVLRTCCYLVLEAAAPEEALTLSSACSTIHILLTDIVMPGMSVYELAERFKTLRPDLEVVFMSGYSAEVERCRKMIASAGAYLAKPFSAEALADMVRGALDQRRPADIPIAPGITKGPGLPSTAFSPASRNQSTKDTLGVKS